jgi:hypothetical protein
MEKDIDNDGSDLDGGMWFSNTGQYYVIDDARYGRTYTAPLRALTGFIKAILPHNVAVRQWISGNPVAKTVETEQGDKDAEMWWKKVACVMIENGWNLAWGGSIHTKNLDAKSLIKALNNVPQAAFETSESEFNWPEDAVVTIKDMEGEECVMRWGVLLGKEKYKETVEETPVAADVLDPATRLQKLKSLLDQNLISEEEYSSKKAEILSQL